MLEGQTVRDEKARTRKVCVYFSDGNFGPSALDVHSILGVCAAIAIVCHG
jgi:hypothetical protein